MQYLYIQDEPQPQAQDAQALGQGLVQAQGPQEPQPQQQGPALKIFGLQVNIKREIKFTEAWTNDLVTVLDVNAEGSILSTSQFKVVLDFRVLADKLRDKLAMETLVLDPGRHTYDNNVMLLCFDRLPGPPVRDLLTLEVNQDCMEIGQKVLRLWEPIIQKSPPCGIVAPINSEDST